MALDLSEVLVVGISSRALFDLTREDALFRQQGLKVYEQFQVANEDTPLAPGPAFPLIKALLNLNQRLPGKRRTEVVIMSRNSAETSLRIFNSIRHYGLDITRAALAGGAPLAPYLAAFSVDLFLSFEESDVQAAIDAGVAAAVVYDAPGNPLTDIDQIRIAFDGDAVLFSEDSEKIYQSQGLDAFLKHEQENARQPLPAGPFAKLLRLLSQMDATCDRADKPIRTALVTARHGPSHERAIRTLQHWGVDVDEAFFLGGVSKDKILEAFRPHMFFDDQSAHCDPASKVVATGKVPWKKSAGGS